MTYNTLTKIKQETIIKLQLTFIAPFLYLTHGIFYNAMGFSSAIIIYTIKISYLIIILDSLLRRGLSTFNNQISKNIFLFYGVTLSISFLASIIYSQYINVFYLIADFVGWIVVPVYVFILYDFLLRKYENIFSLAVGNLIAMFLVIVFYYLISNGAKVSTPPDVQYVISFCISAIIIGLYRPSKIIVLLIFIASLAIISTAQLRMLMMIFLLTVMISLIWNIVIKRKILITAKYTAMLLILVTFFYSPFENTIKERLDTLPIIGNSTDLIEDGYGDASINQRHIEATLVFSQMNKYPLSYFTGMGLGAAYENNLINNEHYSSLQHHLHATIVAIWFRNGLLPLILYISIFFFAFIDLFQKDKFLFVSALALIMQWISSLSDLYVYWGFNFSLAIAVWLFAKLRIFRT